MRDATARAIHTPIRGAPTIRPSGESGVQGRYGVGVRGETAVSHPHRLGLHAATRILHAAWTNRSLEMTCENTALVESNNVTFDGCRDPQVRLTLDANNRAVQLRGRSPRGYEWTVRPK